MNTQEKTYILTSELAETLGILMGQAYKIIRQLNSELAKDIAEECFEAASTQNHSLVFVLSAYYKVLFIVGTTTGIKSISKLYLIIFGSKSRLY